MAKSKAEEEQQPPPGKRPYAPPSVDRLGSLADLTRGVGGFIYDVGQANNTKRGA